MRALDLARMPEDAALLPKVHVNMGITLEAEGMLISACEHYRWAAVCDCAGSLPFGGCGLSAAGPALPWRLPTALVTCRPARRTGVTLCCCHSTTKLCMAMVQPGRCMQGASFRPEIPGMDTGCTRSRAPEGAGSCFACLKRSDAGKQPTERMRSGGAQDAPPCGQLLRAPRPPGCCKHSSCREAPP